MSIELTWKRRDGTFVAAVNGHPYHVVEGDEPLWSDAVAEAAELGDALQFEPEQDETPEPAPLTKTHKATIWRRLTDEEAERLDAALTAAPLRLRRIFEAAQYLDIGDPDYPALHGGVVAALGEERAAEVLAPDH